MGRLLDLRLFDVQLKGKAVKLKLVDNWDEALGWLSMRFIGLTLLWESIPEEAKDTVFSDINQGRITFWLLVAAAVGRMIRQGEVPEK